MSLYVLESDVVDGLVRILKDRGSGEEIKRRLLDHVAPYNVPHNDDVKREIVSETLLKAVLIHINTLLTRPEYSSATPVSSTPPPTALTASGGVTVAAPKPSNTSEVSNPILHFFEQYWWPWQALSEYVYYFIESRLLNFGRLVEALVGIKKQHNALLWLLAQCFPIESAREMLLNDFHTLDNPLFKLMFQLVNHQQAEKSFGFSPQTQTPNANQQPPLFVEVIRDVAVFSLLNRVFTVGLMLVIDPHDFVSRPLYAHMGRAIESAKNWFSRFAAETNRSNDLRPLSPLEQLNIILVTHNPSGLANKAPRLTPPRPPNEIPLPAKMLASLGTNSKFRISEEFIDAIKSAGTEANTIKINSPAVAETLARLIRNVPVLTSAKHSKNFATIDPNQMQSVMLFLSDTTLNRLLRLIVHHYPSIHFLMDVLAPLGIVKHFQVYTSLRRLAMSIAMVIDGRKIPLFRETIPLFLESAPSVQRALLHHLLRAHIIDNLNLFAANPDAPTPADLIRLLIAKVGHTRIVQSWLEQLSEDTRERLISNPIPTPKPRNNLSLCTTKNVGDVVEAIKFGIGNGENAFPKTLENYSLEVLFAALWTIRYQNKEPLDPFSKFQSDWKSAFARFDPKEFEFAHFGFIDFIVRSAFERDDQESFHAEDPRIVRAAKSLAEMVWTHNLLWIDVVVLALCENPNKVAMSVLESLLLNEALLKARLDAFASANILVAPWHDDTFYSKAKAYLAKFPLAFPNVETVLTPVYDLPILALVPALDYALLALLEQGLFNTANALIERYFILYKHHPFPIRLVYQFLYRLNARPVPLETKIKLLKIAGGVSLTPDFEKILNPSLSESEREEMLRSLQTSEHSSNICRQVVISLRKKEIDRFSESTPYVIITDLGDRGSDRLAVKSAAIELMIIGTPAVDTRLLTTHPSELARLFTRLPRSFNRLLFDSVLDVLPNLLPGGLEVQAPSLLYLAASHQATLLVTPLSQIKLMLSCFFRESPGSAAQEYAHWLIQMMVEKNLSSSVLYALWNSVDPFLPRNNSPLEPATISQSNLRNALRLKLKIELPDDFDESYAGKSIRRLFATTTS